MIERSHAAKAAFVTLAYLILTAWNLNLQTIASPDEPRYACAARDMMRGGDLIIPQFNHAPRLVKPILFYWEIALTGTLGQWVGLDTVTGMRLGPLTMGLCVVMGTFVLGVRLLGPRPGMIAALLLMSAVRFHETARELVVDMTLSAFLLWAWIAFIIALDRIKAGKPVWGHLLAFYTMLGLACLTKGPALVALFVVCPVFLYLRWTRQLGVLKRAGLWWGTPLALTLGCWWIGAVYYYGGHNILNIYRMENLTRAIGNKDHREPWPWIFYIIDLTLSYMPGSLLFPAVLLWSAKNLTWFRSSSVQPEENDAGSVNTAKFLICALGFPFFVLGLIISKRTLYLIPIYPIVSIWIAWAIENSFVSREGHPAPSSVKWAIGALAGAACSGIALIWTVPALTAPVGLSSNDLAGITLIDGPLVILLLFAMVNAIQGRRLEIVYKILAVAWAVNFGYECVIRPARERLANSVSFYADLKAKLAGRPVAFFGENANEAIWFLERGENDARIDFVTRPSLKKKFFNAPGTVLLARESELKSTPLLESSIYMDPSVAEPRFKRGNEWLVLAVPNPAHPPSESVFKVKNR